MGARPSTLKGEWKGEGALLGIRSKQRPVSGGTATVKAPAGHQGAAGGRISRVMALGLSLGLTVLAPKSRLASVGKREDSHKDGTLLSFLLSHPWKRGILS